MNAKKTAPKTIPPGEVVIAEMGLMPVVEGLKPEFPTLNKSTVWRWSQPAPRGTAGIVPSRYHVPLMRLAQRQGRSLTADDLIFGRTSTGG
jgi:hypothetical protein